MQIKIMPFDDLPPDQLAWMEAMQDAWSQSKGNKATFTCTNCGAQAYVITFGECAGIKAYCPGCEWTYKSY